MYFAQLSIEQRYQEPQSLDEWARGNRETELIDLSKIDRVPVSMIIASNDNTCPLAYNELLYHEMTTPEKYLQLELGTHWNGSMVYPDRVNTLLQTIEKGYASASKLLFNALSGTVFATILAIIV